VTSVTKHEPDPVADERPRDAPPVADHEPADAFELRHVGRSWDGFFDDPAVSDDFMRERQQPPIQERDGL
jgi:hypothetical protein